MRKRTPPSIDLALQGGGSHGAFTWGVLDRLLEDGRLRFDGVSGCSAGALNAGVLATGWAHGGADGARAALRAFWLDVSSHGTCFGAPGLGAPAAGIGSYNLDTSPLYAWMSQWLKLFSPTQFALHELGRLAAQAWLEKDAGKVGRESSLDIQKTFLARR